MDKPYNPYLNTASAGSCLGAIAQKSPDAPVQSQIYLLRNAVDELAGTVGDLAQRLVPILRLPSVGDAACKPEAEHGQSEIEQGIARERSRVDSAVDHIRDILSRTQV